MPNRLVNGEKVWRSEKLLQVEPESFRAELANLLPLALANGVFECTPGRVRADVYSFNRPSITINKVARILTEFERAKLLFRWRDANDKVWGFWTGIRCGGQLPPPEECKAKRYKTGPEPPADLLEQFLAGEIDSGLEIAAPRKNDPRSDGKPAHSDESLEDSIPSKSQRTDNEGLNNDLPTGSPLAASEQPKGSPVVGVGVGVGVGTGNGAGTGAGCGVGSRHTGVQNTDAGLPAMNADSDSAYRRGKSKPNLQLKKVANIQGKIGEHTFVAERERCQQRGIRDPWGASEQEAFAAIGYSPDLGSPLLGSDFVNIVTLIWQEHRDKGITPGNLCSKIIDECQRDIKDGEPAYWPPDFEEHRDKLREKERAAETTGIWPKGKSANV